MAARTRADKSTAKAKYRYRVTNWAEYDRALVNRGNLTSWTPDFWTGGRH